MIDVEDLVALVLDDADAGVDHPHLDHLTQRRDEDQARLAVGLLEGRARDEAHAAALGRELERVVGEVQEHLPQPFRVTQD